MLKRLFAPLLALVLLLLCLPVSAKDAEPTTNYVEAIERYKGAATLREWLDGELTDNAGKGAEWYAFALIKRNPTLDYTRYEEALREKLTSGTVSSPVSRMNCALALACLGLSPDLIRETLNQGIGQLGIMSWIYGLHLLNAGYEATEYTTADAVEQLLALQKDDGGWAVSGQWGDENAESSAQVLLALSCLGLDAADAGFAGGYERLIEGLSQFATSSGGFSHQIEGDVNELATAQVYLALSSVLAKRAGKSSVYLPDVAPGSFVPTVSGGRFPFLVLYIAVPLLAASTVALIVLRRKRERAAEAPK